MSKKTNITEAEWPILEVLWESGTATAAKIVRAVSEKREVSERTVKTLIRRLIAKDMVTFTVDKNDARVYHYRALVDKEASFKDKADSLARLVYGGRAGELLAHFVQTASLEAEEIDRLRELLEMKKQRSGRE